MQESNAAGTVSASDVEAGVRSHRAVFWTGGWDSTFRVLDLVLQHGETIAPIYVRDEARQSIEHETRVMDRLRQQINQRASAGHLGELRVLNAQAAEPDPELRAKYAELVRTRGIGEQYIWLAELVRQHGLQGIEVCVQYNEDFFFLDPGLAQGKRQYRLEPVQPALDESTPESLFNLFHFPTLHIGKAEMREYARQHGFLDLLEQTWFCHMPTRSGTPCGFCVPCRMVVSKGVGDRLSLRARINGWLVNALEYLPRGYRFKRWCKRKLRGY